MVDWANLSLFVGSISAAVAGLIVATQKSKCSHIECGCIKCDRSIPNIVECNDIENQLENVIDRQPDKPDKPRDNATGTNSNGNTRRPFAGGLPIRPNVPGNI